MRLVGRIQNPQSFFRTKTQNSQNFGFSLQIHQNHLMIIADGVLIQACIKTDIAFQLPDLLLLVLAN